jgi:hypothetical protein
MYAVCLGCDANKVLQNLYVHMDSIMLNWLFPLRNRPLNICRAACLSFWLSKFLCSASGQVPLFHFVWHACCCCQVVEAEYDDE